MTNALLRLSRSVPRIQKEKLVTDIIDELASLFLQKMKTIGVGCRG